MASRATDVARTAPEPMPWPTSHAALPARRRLAALLTLRDLWRTAGGTAALPPVANWSDTMTLADQLLVTPALWPIVDRWATQLPDAVAEHLRHAQRANTVRNLRLRTQLTDSVAALNGAGITPLLLKGARQLVDGSLPRLGERWLSDLDLAVAPERFDAARAALRAIGYGEMPDPFEHPHELPMLRPGDSGPLELHVEIGSPPLPAMFPLAEVWRDSEPLAVGAGEARGLSLAHGVIHNVVHASVQDLNHAVGGLPLRQLVTLTGLVRARGPEFDFAGGGRALRRPRAERRTARYVWLAHRFAALPLPPPVPSVPDRGAPRART